MDTLDLAALQKCLVPDFEYTVTNWLTDVNHILRAVSNHIAEINLPSTKSEGSGGATNSTASIPMLEESITKTQWASWTHGFDH